MFAGLKRARARVCVALPTALRHRPSVPRAETAHCQREITAGETGQFVVSCSIKYVGYLILKGGKEVCKRLVLLAALFPLSLVCIVHIFTADSVDYKKAKAEAERGSAWAQMRLGVMYDNGEGVPQDYGKAMKWFRKAAEQDFDLAQYDLGVMYYNGQSVPQDYVEAMKWFRKAAEQGYDLSQFNLGVMYFNGQGVPQNYAEAMKWYRKAAEQGVSKAQQNVGVMYFTGDDVPQDYVQAHLWLNLAASQGLSDAKKLRDTVAAIMTPSQIAEAQRLAREWKPKGKED